MKILQKKFKQTIQLHTSALEYLYYDCREVILATKKILKKELNDGKCFDSYKKH